MIRLFNKKKQALAKAHEQAETLQRRLDEAERQRADLEDRITTVARVNTQLDTRISTLDQAQTQLDTHLGALDQGVRSLGEQLIIASSSGAETSQLVRSIDERLGAADIRVDAIHHRMGEMEARTADIDEINERLRELAARSSPITTTPPPPPSGDTSGITASPTPPPPPSFDESGDRALVDLRAQVDELLRQHETVDTRVTRVSTELANQLTELSRDIELLNENPNSEPADGGAVAADSAVDSAAIEARLSERLDAALDDVLDSTERLAAEQARYEIQFRADLAELAERIRRPGSP